ncbi:MAG: SPOR domain-containing protein [Magnetococcales bacterium]|nr:SPOR domain-containing protein [Magnetococcales bacterium]
MTRIVGIFCFSFSLLLMVTGSVLAVEAPSEIGQKEGEQRFQLTIITEPTEATVEILNSSIAYSPGVRLPSGRYNISVSFPGYEEEKGYIEILSKDWVGKVVLRPEETQPDTSAIDEEWQRIHEEKVDIEEARRQLEKDQQALEKAKIEIERQKKNIVFEQLELAQAQYEIDAQRLEISERLNQLERGEKPSLAMDSSAQLSRLNAKTASDEPISRTGATDSNTLKPDSAQTTVEGSLPESGAIKPRAKVTTPTANAQKPRAKLISPVAEAKTPLAKVTTPSTQANKPRGKMKQAQTPTPLSEPKVASKKPVIIADIPPVAPDDTRDEDATSLADRPEKEKLETITFDFTSESSQNEAPVDELQPLLDATREELKVYQTKAEGGGANTKLNSQIEMLKNLAPNDPRVQQLLRLYKKRYIIVVGLFSAEERAIALKERILNAGLPSYHEPTLVNNNTLYRVAIGLFENRSQAQTAKKKLLAEKFNIKEVIFRSFKK